MPTFQVRNKRTKMILGTVSVADPTEVLAALADTTGTTIDDIATSLGSTVEAAKEALDVVEVREPKTPGGAKKKVDFAPLPRRAMFG